MPTMPRDPSLKNVCVDSSWMLISWYCLVSILLSCDLADAWLRHTHHVTAMIITFACWVRFLTFIILNIMDQCSEENSGAFFFTSTAPSLLFVMACGTCARWMILPLFKTKAESNIHVYVLTLIFIFVCMGFSIMLLIMSYDSSSTKTDDEVLLFSLFGLYFGLATLALCIGFIVQLRIPYSLSSLPFPLGTKAFSYIIAITCVLGSLGRVIVMFVGALQRPVNIGYVDFSEGGTLFGPYYYYLFTDLLVLVLLSYLRHIFTGGSSSSSSSSFRLSSRMSVSSHSSHSFPGFGLKEGEEQGEGKEKSPRPDSFFEGLPVIQQKDLKLGDQIGDGLLATLYKGEWTGATVAIKHFHVDLEAVGHIILQELAREMELLRKSRHPNIIQYYGTTALPFLSVVTEYMELGSLDDSLLNPHHRQVLDLPRSRSMILSQVASGMTYLHQCNVLHRDLTPTNILLNKKGTAKISDFGLARIKQMTQALVGTPTYAAPEVIDQFIYSKAGDVYSFGIVVWRVVCEKIPWDGVSIYDVFDLVVEGNHPGPAEEIPPLYREIVEQCWDQLPDSRPDFAYLLKSLKFIQEHDLKEEAEG